MPVVVTISAFVFFLCMMDLERMLVCVLLCPMDAETHSIPAGVKIEGTMGIRRSGGRGLHTTRKSNIN